MLKKQFIVAAFLAVATFFCLGWFGLARRPPVRHITATSAHIATARPSIAAPVFAAPPAPAPVGDAAPQLAPPPPPPPAAPSAPDFGQLVQGQAVWQGPAQMTSGDTAPVGISIGGQSVAAAALRQALTGAMGQLQGAQSGASAAQIAARMTATLFGVGFTVTPPAPQLQEVSFTAPTTWSWQVTADQPGRRFLTVVLAAQLSGGEVRTTLTEPIVVEVKPATTLDRLNGAIAYLTAIKTILALLAAIVGFIFTKPVVGWLERGWASRGVKKQG